MELRGAGVLVLVEGAARVSVAVEAERRLGGLGLEVLVPELSAEALEADRPALRELERALGELERRPGIDRARLAAVGFGRGGTLAFLLGCARRLAAVVDVDGPVLYPELSSAQPIQPLELGLNLEGAFLGVFAGREPRVTDEELGLLRDRLEAAARPHEIVVLDDACTAQSDAIASEEVWNLLADFLVESLGA